LTTVGGTLVAEQEVFMSGETANAVAATITTHAR
jgi:hypothetical protein